MILTVIQTSRLTYILNDHEFSREDFCLLLELSGFEVDRDLPPGDFWRKSLESLSQLCEDEFYEVFNRFISYSELERAIWQQLVTTRKFVVVDNFNSN